MLKILGYNYTLIRVDDADALDALGRFQTKKLKIEVATDICDQQVTSVILHEIIEAINYHNQLRIEHNAIMSLEAGLYQVLTENGVNLDALKKHIDNQ